jgi:adenylate cyclase class IV
MSIKELETEVKILEIDPKIVIDTLRQIGAKEVFNGEIITYDFKPSDKNQFIRFRHMTDLRNGGIPNKNLFYRKTERAVKDAKVYDEESVELNDEQFGFILTVFQGLNMSYKWIQKERISFQHGSFRVDIDTLLSCDIKGKARDIKIPTFMEIEGKSYDAIKNFALITFGLKENQLKPWNTKKLLEHYKIV